MTDISLVGRLSFTPSTPHKAPLPAGRHNLGIAAERDAVLIVPKDLAGPNLATAKPVPLIVLFHGAGGSADKILPFFEAQAEDYGFLLLVPQSQFPTWDLVIGGNGPDIERLDAALAEVGAHYALDPGHFAFAGYSDGGSYALSLGLTNGALVSHIMAFSAGFISVVAPQGTPQIFIAHGIRDEQLPIATSARANAAKLQDAGYHVQYIEFNGTHMVMPPIVSLAMNFFLQ